MKQNNNTEIREGVEKRSARIEILTTPTGKKRIENLARQHEKTVTRYMLDQSLNPAVELRLAKLENQMNENFAEFHDFLLIFEAQLLENIGKNNQEKALIMFNQYKPISKGDFN